MCVGNRRERGGGRGGGEKRLVQKESERHRDQHGTLLTATRRFTSGRRLLLFYAVVAPGAYVQDELPIPAHTTPPAGDRLQLAGGLEYIHMKDQSNQTAFPLAAHHDNYNSGQGKIEQMESIQSKSKVKFALTCGTPSSRC